MRQCEISQQIVDLATSHYYQTYYIFTGYGHSLLGDPLGQTFDGASTAAVLTALACMVPFVGHFASKNFVDAVFCVLRSALGQVSSCGYFDLQQMLDK